jgi:hypothetical protein
MSRPTTDGRWLVMPRYTQPGEEHQSSAGETEVGVARMPSEVAFVVATYDVYLLII